MRARVARQRRRPQTDAKDHRRAIAFDLSNHLGILTGDALGLNIKLVAGYPDNGAIWRWTAAR
jgi:hypothetical protein